MKVTEKIQLIENIATTLQAKYTYNDIDTFLAEFAVNTKSSHSDYNSKRVYVKSRLQGVSINEIKKIADELDIRTENIIVVPPKNWQETVGVKIFLSHLAKDKEIATRLRDTLKPYNIDAFVAHQDIKPSEQWLEEIDKALRCMDIFISIHTKGFKDSVWCQQEVGFAVARSIKVIPIKFGEDPTGFISKFQALNRGRMQAEGVAKAVVEIIKNDKLTKDIYIEKIAAQYESYNDIPF